MSDFVPQLAVLIMFSWAMGHCAYLGRPWQ